MRFPVCLLCCLFLAMQGCTDPGIGSSKDADAGGIDSPPPYPEPNGNVVSPVGSSSTLDIATWNIENFPAKASTPSDVADLIVSLDLDVVVLQEIANEEAFTELDERLRGYSSYLSSHVYSFGGYQKLAILYRTDEVTLENALLLFSNDGYGFPRPAIKGDIVYQGQTIELVGVHLKAGFDGSDFARRDSAMDSLKEYGDTRLAAGSHVLMLGDYNSEVDQQQAWQDIRSDENFQILSEPLHNNGAMSYVPSGRLIDHTVATTALANFLQIIQVPNLNETTTDYVSSISDHLPVVSSFSFP